MDASDRPRDPRQAIDYPAIAILTNAALEAGQLAGLGRLVEGHAVLLAGRNEAMAHWWEATDDPELLLRHWEHAINYYQARFGVKL